MAAFLRRNLTAVRTLKEKLYRGEVCTLIHTSHSSPSLVEKLGEIGFDAAMIDCEHGAIGPERAEEMARAASLAGIVSILRPEDPAPWMVTKYLECGVDGLMVPLVSDAETARKIVERFRFSDPFEYESRMLIVMIETIDAVNNLPEIMAVDGIDAFLVAPGDLALTLGASPITYEWQKGVTPEVVQTEVRRAISTIVGAGKVCGTLVNHTNVGEFLDQGVTLLYDHANHMLTYGARDFLSRLKR